MRNKRLLFILLGFLIVCLIGGGIFFALQGISAANKKREYFDVYRAQAEEYIQASPEIIAQYGEDNISVTFDGSVTYSESGEKGFLDRYIEVFKPNVPDTLEEFSEGMDMIKFKLEINGDAYEIIFEKNEGGDLAVSDLIAVAD